MAKILGISAFYHDSAAALVDDGSIVGAAQEERFSRVKHDARFPSRAVEYLLGEGGANAEELDYVVFYEKPLQKFDRLIETYLAFAPSGFGSFSKALPQWLKTKLHLPREIKSALGGRLNCPIVFTGHHESHAASAYYISPFEDSAIITMDGVGEWETSTIGHGNRNIIELLKFQSFPHSLGLLYSSFTFYCGFRVNSGEYKLMGLAPYGNPKYYDLILDNLIDLKEDGSLSMNMEYFDYCHGLTMTNHKFHDLFGGSPRNPDSKIEQRHMDCAASIQKITEEAVLRMGKYACRITGSKNLCLAGGVALNCVANGKLARSGIFNRVFIAPASGDAGGALGAALFTHYQLLESSRELIEENKDKGSLLGPRHSNDGILQYLKSSSIPYKYFEHEKELLTQIASDIAKNKVIGWFSGRMEFGPRALGARSIIGDPRSGSMQSKMNMRIKFRESFRPFAPSVLAEKVSDYFEMEEESPYMLLVAKVKKELRKTLSYEEEKLMKDSDLIKRVNIQRSALPAITHVDMSARVQTVDEKRHGRFYRLIKEFEKQTGCGVIMNTSFNVRGEPIVCSPEDAYQCFMATDMDVLVMENYVLQKSEQPKQKVSIKNEYIARFRSD